MLSNERWVEVTTSQFAHEIDGLQHIRSILPDVDPYRVWCNFEFRDSQGRWHECDAMVLTRDTLHLVELKHYSGRLTGDDHYWRLGSGRVEDSPLKLTRRKAQRIASKLKSECERWLKEEQPHLTRKQVADYVRQIVPFVKESVYLHSDHFVCDLPASSKTDLYGLDGDTEQTKLPGISDLLLSAPSHKELGENASAILVGLIKRLGLVQRREREVGSWVIQEGAIAEGDGWQEWQASHKYNHELEAKARIYTPGNDESYERVRKLALHEWAVTQSFKHDSIATPQDFIETEQGPGLIFDAPRDAVRLDLWLAEGDAAEHFSHRLKVVEQIADALRYAHDQGLAHRQLSPLAITVQSDPLLARVGGWILSGRVDASEGVTQHVQAGDLADMLGEESAWVSCGAPEANLSSDYDRKLADVFSLGAVAYYVLTGKPAADSSSELRAKLQRDSCLDVSHVSPDVPAHIVEAIKQATCGSVTKRLRSAADFLELLQQEPAEPQEQDVEVFDLAKAEAGSVVGGRFQIVRRLGQGSTSVAFEVCDLTSTAKTPTNRVLKVAVSDEASRHIEAEAETLRALRPRKLKNVVKLIDGPFPIGDQQALLLSHAGDTTLAESLSGLRQLPLDLLIPLSRQLLEVVVDLERLSVFHRDIKPANLGWSAKSNRPTLRLFDFSLAGTAANQTGAGTRAYLDPFLGGMDRPVFDSAAERYSAAVVLFEMATGSRPQFGDGLSDPAAIPDEATVSADMFDPALARGMVLFFRRALARNASDRYRSAQTMLSAWESLFTSDITTATPESNNDVAEQVSWDTPLMEAGLTPAALSLTRAYGLTDVASFLECGLTPFESARKSSAATRRELSDRYVQWKKSPGMPPSSEEQADSVKDDWDVIRTALSEGGSHRRSSLQLAKLIFGLGNRVSTFATNSTLGQNFPKAVTAGRVAQVWADLLERVEKNDKGRKVLDSWHTRLVQHIDQAGGVIEVNALVDDVRDSWPGSAKNNEIAYTAGLLRVAAFRASRVSDDREAKDAESTEQKLWKVTLVRRTGDRVYLATDADLVGPLEAAAHRADELFGDGAASVNDVVPPGIAAREVRAAFASAWAHHDKGDRLPRVAENDAMLMRAAAAFCKVARATSKGGLHHADMPVSRAASMVLDELPVEQSMSHKEFETAVTKRFAAVKVPSTPQGVAQLVAESSGQWFFDERSNRVCSRIASRPATDLSTATSYTRSASVHRPDGATDNVLERIDQSIAERGFVAFGVPALRQAERFVDLARVTFHATEFNVSARLLALLREFADAHGAEWHVVLNSDAPTASAADYDRLCQAVHQVVPQLTEQLTALLEDPSETPVLLTDVALLYRFDHSRLITELADITRPRQRAVWLVLPQRDSLPPLMVAGEQLKLSAQNQFVSVDAQWVATHRVKEPV